MEAVTLMSVSGCNPPRVHYGFNAVNLLMAAKKPETENAGHDREQENAN
jgi:hypothetical protein